MNNALDAMCGDHALDEVFVAGVADEQRYAFGHEGGKSGRQIIDHHNGFAGFSQRMNRVTSNIAGAAGDKHSHEFTHLPDYRLNASRDAVKSGFRRRRTGHYD